MGKTIWWILTIVIPVGIFGMWPNGVYGSGFLMNLGERNVFEGIPILGGILTAITFITSLVSGAIPSLQAIFTQDPIGMLIGALLTVAVSVGVATIVFSRSK